MDENDEKINGAIRLLEEKFSRKYSLSLEEIRDCEIIIVNGKASLGDSLYDDEGELDEQG